MGTRATHMQPQIRHIIFVVVGAVNTIVNDARSLRTITKHANHKKIDTVLPWRHLTCGHDGKLLRCPAAGFVGIFLCSSNRLCCGCRGGTDI